MEIIYEGASKSIVGFVSGPEDSIVDWRWLGDEMYDH